MSSKPKVDTTKPHIRASQVTHSPQLQILIGLKQLPITGSVAKAMAV